jgi:hypothetical protein
MTRARRTAHVEIDPALRAAVAALVQAHGKDAVIAAAEQAGRRHPVEASRDELARIAALIDRLDGVMDKDAVFAFLGKQRAMGIPVAISIEVLERVHATMARNPWALIRTIMREDYPHYRWDGAPARMWNAECEMRNDMAIGGTSDEE